MYFSNFADSALIFFANVIKSESSVCLLSSSGFGSTITGTGAFVGRINDRLFCFFFSASDPVEPFGEGCSHEGTLSFPILISVSNGLLYGFCNLLKRSSCGEVCPLSGVVG